jgi:hypothetical protein
MKKSLQIATNGVWDADAISLFQEKILNFINHYPKIFINAILVMSEEESASVWHFLFDGLHPSQQVIKTRVLYFERLFNDNHKQKYMINAQYEKLLLEENN